MAGYSQTPLLKKLGIKPGFRVVFLDPPPSFLGELGELPDGVQITTTRSSQIDFIHLFVTQRSRLISQLQSLMTKIRPDGMIWVSWPKKASKVSTDITEDVIREIALPLGLVDIKVCAIDEVWSGLKLVIRKNRR